MWDFPLLLGILFISSEVLYLFILVFVFHEKPVFLKPGLESPGDIFKNTHTHIHKEI